MANITNSPLFYPIFIQSDFLAQLVEQQTLNLWVQGSNP